MSPTLCDGCHYEVELCACAEWEAQRVAEFGPICHACGGGADDDYEQCEFAGDPVYEPGPGGPGSYGCPRVTGTF